ncbi:MAG TPA: hypothetical protein VIV12_13195 [Streptosporangiaceae bacterium]
MVVQQPWVAFPLASSGTVTDATVVSELFQNWHYKGALIVGNRTADTGTCTLNGKLRGYDRVSDTYFDVVGAAFTAWADNAHSLKYILVYPGCTGSDADGSIAKSTDYLLVNDCLPHEFVISMTHGGTSVANTFSVTIFPLA